MTVIDTAADVKKGREMGEGIKVYTTDGELLMDDLNDLFKDREWVSPEEYKQKLQGENEEVKDEQAG